MRITVPENMTAFVSDWSRFHRGQFPLAYLLRDAGEAPRIRVYALPQSKRYARYAENKAERAEIRRRARILAADILGCGAACWLVQAAIVDGYVPRFKPPVAKDDSGMRLPDEGNDSRPADDQLIWAAWVSAVRWEDGAFDALLRDIAEDHAWPTLWMNRATGAIFAPYDGGFDLFPATATDIDLLKQRYADWLSTHLEGL